MKKSQIMRFWTKTMACLAALFLLLSGCGRDALPDSKQAVTSSGISGAASSTPAASPAPTEDPNANKMPYLFEEYISLPEHEMLVPTEEQKQQVEAFIGRNPEEACEFIDGCYATSTAIYLLDVTGDEVPEICVTGWTSDDASTIFIDLGSGTTIVFDLATGEYKGNFEGSPKDFYWCETESGSRVALGFELNWTRIYRSGYDACFLAGGEDQPYPVAFMDNRPVQPTVAAQDRHLGQILAGDQEMTATRDHLNVLF